MKRTQLFTMGLASTGILILILDSRTAIAGAQSGIDLCIRIVIPSLFPFFLLSILLTGTFVGISSPLLNPLEKLCSIPSGTGAILVSGFLGGYPTGAQCAAAAYRSGYIQKKDAERMLSFCSNAGPAFLFGMVSAMFPSMADAFLLWAIHIGTALIVAVILPPSPSIPAKVLQKEFPTIADAMHSAVTVMATVCGWVVLFRVVIAFLERWFLWALPVSIQVLIAGVLELSNGCHALSRINDPAIRFVLCSCMLGWGGLCVTMQTHSAVAGLSIKPYLKGKVMQTLYSLLISVSVVLDIWVPVLAFLILLIVILQKAKKRGGNPLSVGV